MTVLFHATPSLREERPPGGAHTSPILRKGQILHLTGIGGGASVSVMTLNPHEKSGCLNLPDTLKGQHTARLIAGHCSYSDMGRVLAGIVADSRGWHGLFGGILDAEEIYDEHDAGHYQELRNGLYRNSVDSLLMGMGKWDLDLGDLPTIISFFNKVTVDDEGRFQFVAGNSRARNYIELFAPMGVLLVLIVLPHPQDPVTEYAPCPVQLSWRQANDEDAAIQALLTRGGSQRAFRNTQPFAL